MAGNVYEWVEDDWHDDYNGVPTDGSAWVDSPRGEYRIMRGGGFGTNALGLRAAARGAPFLDLDFQNDHIGFRCAR